MKEFSTPALLKDIEIAISSQNYGRMYEIGVHLIHMARSEPGWYDAVIVITGYLTKNPTHQWNAFDLSKRAALSTPEGTAIQQTTMKAMVACIELLPAPKDKVEAAYSVVAVAPKGGSLLHLSINLMMDHVLHVDDAYERKRYIKIVIYYAPDEEIKMKGEVLLSKTVAMMETKRRHGRSDAKAKPMLDLPLSAFVDKHKFGLEEVFVIEK